MKTMHASWTARLTAFAIIPVALALVSGCGDKEKSGASADSTSHPMSTMHSDSMGQHAQGDMPMQSSAGEVKTYVFHGEVKSIDEANMMVTIDHEKIDGYMDAMTMPYKVADAAILKQLHVGDKTHFTLRVSGDQALITKVQKEHEGDEHDDEHPSIH